MEPPTYLAELHPHERDAHISFDEGPHIYTIDGDSGFMSVTTWNHSHFPHFNADKIIKKMMASKNWSNSKYFGMTADEIKAQWNENGRLASEAGTKMHYDIECYYNDMAIEVYEDCKEFNYFLVFDKDHNDLKPYRTEWMVWDKELQFAGSIDMIYKNDDGTLSIYDWKRCKEIKKDNKWETASLECLDPYDIPNSNFWHYAFQLNIYKYIIEKNYNKSIKSLYLVCLHPNNKNKNYIKIYVPFLTNQIKDLMKYRKEVTLA